MKIHKSFDLETALDQWRQSLDSSGDFNKDQQEELTSHLRDELDNLAGNSLSDEEKWLVAQQRIGSVGTLQAAFTQQKGLGMQKLIWGLQAIILLWLFNNLVTLFNWIGADIILANKLHDALTKYSISFGLQAIGLIPLLLVIKYLVKLHRTGKGTVKANLFMVGALALTLALRVIYLQLDGYAAAVYEPIIAHSLTVALAPLVTIVVVLVISWREYKLNRARALA